MTVDHSTMRLTKLLSERAPRNNAARVVPYCFTSYAARFLYLAVGATLLCLLGCTNRAAVVGSPESSPDNATSSQLESARTSAQLEPVKRDELERIVGEYRGRVVLVDYWATWCVACLEMLPHLVELERRLREEGLVVIAVSLDSRDQPDRAKKMLQSRGIAFRSLISRGDNLQQAFIDFDLEALPTYRIYDRRGRLVATFSGSVRAEDIDRAVESALREGSESIAGGQPEP